ncbi:MAG: MBL fold metallo-hydrolase [Candidatus Aminicenantales bacterium]
MEVTIWGARGTFPSPRKDTVCYGGHTCCLSLRTAAGEYIVVDSGTGIRDLGERIMAEAEEAGNGPVRIHLLLTHFHLDHIMGFPFFQPLFSPRATVFVYAPVAPEETRKHLAGLMAGRYFPVRLDETRSTKVFLECEPGLVIGGVGISSCPLVHPQGSVAYRLESGGRSVVSATDTEHPEKGIDERLAAFAAGATRLIYDAMFTPEEYAAAKKGWGHSTWLAATELAAGARVGGLIMSHYNPDHSDEMVDRLLAAARRIFPRAEAARQGWSWDLSKG